MDFSIVIPAYNVESYIYQCIESAYIAVSNLDFCSAEIVIVDDGSSDNTVGIVNQFFEGKKCRWVLVLHEGNRGPSAARNSGIKASAGKYILLLDADDYLKSDVLINLQHYIASDPNTDVFVLGMGLVDEIGAEVGTFYGDRAEADPASFLKVDPWGLLFQNCIGSFVLLSREVFNLESFDESISLGEDWDLWIRLFLVRKVRFIFVPEICGYCRLRAGSAIATHGTKILKRLNSGIRIYMKLLVCGRYRCKIGIYRILWAVGYHVIRTTSGLRGRALSRQRN